MAHPLESMLSYARQTAGNNQVVASVVFKELLHYDILYALAQTPLADRLVFRGGTALRLCYGGDRYSEDLDFVCPAKLLAADWRQFEEILKRTVAATFGCEISLQPPTQEGGEHVAVERWQARVYLPREIAGQVRTERINIEVAHLPAWEAAFRFVRNNHPLQATKVGYGDILLQVESEREILADKVVALAGRPYLKARDIWDMNWLLQKGVQVDATMVAEKAERYGLASVSAALDTAIRRLRDPGAPERFRREMARFLLSSNARHLANERLTRQFFDATKRLVQEVKAAHEPRRARTAAPRARAQPGKNKRGARKKAARPK